MKKRLIKVLSFLPEGQGIYLGNDVFLTGLLNGSDKIYGFAKINGEYMVVTSDTEYPINDMDDVDIKFVFHGNPCIYDKITTASYRIDDFENI